MPRKPLSLTSFTINNYITDPGWLLKEDLKIAKDLCYPKEVIEMLENEPDPIKRQRIMNDTRMGKYRW